MKAPDRTTCGPWPRLSPSVDTLERVASRFPRGDVDEMLAQLAQVEFNVAQGREFLSKAASGLVVISAMITPTGIRETRQALASQQRPLP